MVTAQDNPLPTTSLPQPQTKVQVVSSGGLSGKEKEPLKTAEAVEEIGIEREVPKEVKQAGVEQIEGKIELPPDLKKLGVTQVGSTTPVVTQGLPNIVLPISDQQVIKGLHQRITSALKWLAVWCLRKLRKAHLKLKVIHGKIMRVRD